MSSDDDDFAKQIEKITADPKDKEKKEPPKDRERKATVSRLPNRKPLQPRLEKMFAGMGLMLAPIDSVCGMQIVQSSGPLSEAFENLANQNPRVRKVLERLLSGGAWGEVFVASMPIIVTVLSHHKILPPAVTDMFAGSPEPEPSTNGTGEAKKVDVS